MAEPQTTYAMKGRLTLSRSGWVLLEVPNAIGNGAFQSLSEHGIEQPISETTGRYNAHVSVIRPEEVAAIGGPDKIKARGQTIGFNIGQVREIANPGGWPEVSKVWVIEVRSPELMKLRRSLGLGDPKYPFHITFAIRKRNALAKAASIVHFGEKSAGSTVIRPSEIEGQGLFAARPFHAGDVIDAQFMRRSSGDDGRDRWEQSEQSRFTNHSDDANCELVRDGDTVRFIANRDIASGEELTGDYESCQSVLGDDFDFTYRGKPYQGESSTVTTRRRSHPTSDAILSALSDETARDVPSVQETDTDSGSGEQRSAGPSRADSSASDVRESDVSDESGVDHTDDYPAGDTAGLVHRHKEAGSLALGSYRRLGAEYSVQRQGTSRHPGGDADSYERAGVRCQAGSAGHVRGNLAYSKTAESRRDHLLDLTVNKNQPDYGARLVNLRKRRGECPGCGQTFKEDEPYSNVEMCEVCERFGKPKLIKEGTDLAVQIATARKQTAKPTSKAQAQAGNYAKGKIRMHGMVISLENPKGSTRSGTDPNGKAWSVTMKADYGYINGTEGKDEDHVDVFIGPNPDAEMVFVVDQVSPSSGRFDEHKVMLGYLSETDAKAAYLAHYEDGWQGLKNITPLTMRQFRWWLDKGDQTKPMNGVQVKTAANSFYLNAVQQTPIVYNPQSGITNNVMTHLQSVKARGDRSIQEAGSLDRLQNAMDPNRATRQLSSYLSGQRQPLVNHPLDRFLSEIK